MIPKAQMSDACENCRFLSDSGLKTWIGRNIGSQAPVNNRQVWALRRACHVARAGWRMAEKHAKRVKIMSKLSHGSHLIASLSPFSVNVTIVSPAPSFRVSPKSAT